MPSLGLLLTSCTYLSGPSDHGSVEDAAFTCFMICVPLAYKKNVGVITWETVSSMQCPNLTDTFKRIFRSPAAHFPGLKG